MIRRSWRSFLAGVVLLSGVMTAANAGDVYNAGATDQRTQQIFSQSGNQLTLQLASMSCVEDSCCDGEGCTTGCADGCKPGCGDGTCGDGTCGDVCCPDYCGANLFSSFGRGGEIAVGGWVQLGYHNNVTPLSTGVNQGFSFNDHPHKLNLHQGWLYVEKIADGSCGPDWGFRVDGVYGVDGRQTQAFGNDGGVWDFQARWTHGDYAFAIPQAYVDFASGDWNLRVGHFYTIAGYEVVTAPDNFFYSHALTMFNSEPFTHTGALATYSASDDLTYYAGWTLGWDTGFDSRHDGSNFIGGVSTELNDSISMTYVLTWGEFGWRGNGYAHSFVFDIAVTDRLNYVVQSDLTRTNNHDNNRHTPGKDDDVGVNQYLLYTINDQLAAGTRIEWWKDEGKSQWAATFGVNIKPTDNIVLRPEIRHDWQLAGPNGSETTFGIDAILTF